MKTKPSRCGAGLAWLMAVAMASVLIAQTPPNASSHPVPAARAAAPGNAIEVHGHWIIDVRNPDGSVASHNDFQNALVTSGQQVLSYLVSGSSIVTWDVRLRSSSLDLTGPCSPNANDSSCYIVGPGSALPTLNPGAPNLFTTGAFARTAAGTLEITGNATAAAAVSIGYVESIAEATGGLGVQPFSARALNTPIQVAIGQKLYVKVIVSFGGTDTSGDGGGGGGGGLDSDSDGVPDANDPCPMAPNPFINGVGYCPASIYDIMKEVLPIGSHVELVNVLVTAIAQTSVTVAVDSNDTGYQGPDYSYVIVELGGITAPAVGNRVTVLGTSTAAGSFPVDPSIYVPGSMSAVSITVTSAF